MGDVTYIVSGTVNGNDGSAFSAVARKAADACKAGEPDTLTYDWHVSEDGSTFTIVETFKNDAALQHHVKHMTGNGILEELVKTVAIERVHVITPVNADSRAMLDNFGAIYMEKSASI